MTGARTLSLSFRIFSSLFSNLRQCSLKIGEDTKRREVMKEVDNGGYNVHGFLI
jgi:hypothetical protein